MQKLYYYTSTDTMSKILQNGNIWATNLEYMNDSREYLNGINEIRKLVLNSRIMRGWFASKQKRSEYEACPVKEIFSEQNGKEKQDMSSYYTISFCRKKDLLSQWTTYAKESGVCLEMAFEEDKAKEYLLYQKGHKAQDDRDISVEKKLKEIYYFTKERNDEQKYRETAVKILTDLFGEKADNLDSDSLLERWAQISIYVKQYDFYQEEEVRLAFDTMEINSETGKQPQIGYRTDRQVLKPYLDVQCRDGWPVASVMVGPGYNQDVVYKSIKFFLDHETIKSSALVTDEQWKEQIKSYLCSNKKIHGLWKQLEKGKSVPDNVVQSLYNHWIGFSMKSKEDMMADITEVMKKQNYQSDFENCYFTRSGIIVEKSSVPYIY